MDKYLIILATGLVLLVVFATAQFVFRTTAPELNKQESAVPQFEDGQKTQITIADAILEVEVVNTPESTARGLSGREEIGSDGMLFIFPRAEIRSFWMPEMLFDIDIIWINQDKVVGVSPNVPKPLPGQTTLPTYQSQAPTNVVLEVPAGSAAALSIVEGVQVEFLSK